MRKITIKQRFLPLVLGIVLAITSCNNWLSVSPKADMKAEDLFSTEAGFRDGLIGVYAMMSGSRGYGQRLTYSYVDVLAQYYNSPLKGTSTGAHNFNKAATYQYTDKDEEIRLDSIWSYSYKAITNINLALQFIDKKREVFSSDDIFYTYKGEYLALRAFLHFDILRLFASSPKMMNGFDSPAIPYIDIYTNLAQPQLTVRETLAKIEGDLIAAKEIMKGRDFYGQVFEKDKEPKPVEAMQRREERMNYWAVTALLSRVYLYADKKSEALAQAKEVIGEAGSESTNAFTLTSSAATTKNPMFESEILFRLDVQKLKTYTEKHFVETSLSGSNILTISEAGKKNIFDGQGLDTDFRGAWLNSSSDGKSSIITKYKDMKYIPMLKISELYLIAAESAPGQEGLNYLNKLRSHRGLSLIENVTDSNVNIYKEYRREFIGEGQLFFFYKRNVYEMIGAEDKIGATPAEKIYNLPIPLNEKDFGNIKQ